MRKRLVRLPHFALTRCGNRFLSGLAFCQPSKIEEIPPANVRESLCFRNLAAVKRGHQVLDFDPLACNQPKFSGRWHRHRWVLTAQPSEMLAECAGCPSNEANDVRQLAQILSHWDRSTRVGDRA
jgi:hypothetical protein